MYVLNSSNTDFVGNSIIHIFSHNMERHYLDAKYTSGALPREVINYSNDGREMKWSSIDIGYKNPVVVV